MTTEPPPVKDFPEMTSLQLHEYAGPVYTARCVILHLHTGNECPHDFQAPTAELREQHVRKAVGKLGPLLSRTDYYTPTRKPNPCPDTQPPGA